MFRLPTRMPSLIARLATVGVSATDDADTRVRKGTLTLTATSVSVMATAWILTYLALDRPVAAAIPFTYQVVSVAGLALLARTHRDDAFRQSQIVLMLVLPVLLQWSLGGFVNGSAVLIWAFVAPMGALVFSTQRVAIVTFLALVALTVLSGLIDPWLAARAQPMPAAVVQLFFVLDIAGVASVTFLVLLYFVRDRQRFVDELDKAGRELRIEQDRSETLLRNMLPDAVAARLKDEPGIIADRYEAVTVLFVDVVDFTPLAARLGPVELVSLLDRIFSALDELTDRHGLAKIKTAGDSYMAVAGLPQPMTAERGAVAAAEMALEVVPTIARLADDQPGLKVRVGMHTGPVVAGVIGRRRFAYDLWGDAVNIASRMESQGLPGRIQVSLSTFELLRQRFVLSKRGTIDIKGRGEMATYLLEARRASGG